MKDRIIIIACVLAIFIFFWGAMLGLMLLVRWLTGDDAMYWVIGVLGALLVYLIGRYIIKGE